MPRRAFHRRVKLRAVRGRRSRIGRGHKDLAPADPVLTGCPIASRMASGLLARREQTSIFLLHAGAGIAGPVAFPQIGAVRRAHIFAFDLGNATLHVGWAAAGSIRQHRTARIDGLCHLQDRPVEGRMIGKDTAVRQAGGQQRLSEILREAAIEELRNGVAVGRVIMAPFPHEVRRCFMLESRVGLVAVGSQPILHVEIPADRPVVLIGGPSACQASMADHSYLQKCRWDLLFVHSHPHVSAHIAGTLPGHPPNTVETGQLLIVPGSVARPSPGHCRDTHNQSTTKWHAGYDPRTLKRAQRGCGCPFAGSPMRRRSLAACISCTDATELPAHGPCALFVMGMIGWSRLASPMITTRPTVRTFSTIGRPKTARASGHKAAGRAPLAASVRCSTSTSAILKRAGAK